MTTHNIAVVRYPGAQQAAVLGLRDLLQAASRHYAPPSASLSVSVVDEGGLRAPERPVSALILPPSMGEPPTALSSSVWGQWIRSRHAEGTVLCSVCVGAFLLAEIGLLDGRPATTHWGIAARFQERFPAVRLDTDRLFVDDGDVLTAGGMMAWVDLGLHLIARFLGPSAMLATARHFLVDPGGREQRFYRTFSPVMTHGDAPILAAQRTMQARLAERVSVSALAAAAAMSERTFNRRFQKATGLRATAYMQQLRVHHARGLLESTALNQQELAWAVGYEDAGAFRNIFERIVGLSPGEYRRRFQPAG